MLWLDKFRRGLNLQNIYLMSLKMDLLKFSESSVFENIYFFSNFKTRLIISY